MISWWRWMARVWLESPRALRPPCSGTPRVACGKGRQGPAGWGVGIDGRPGPHPASLPACPHPDKALGGSPYRGASTASLPEGMAVPIGLPHALPAAGAQAPRPMACCASNLASFPCLSVTQSLKNQDVHGECHPNWGPPTRHFIFPSSPAV